MAVFCLAVLLAGCNGGKKNLTMLAPDSGPGGSKNITFPNGIVTGGASQEQASVLARIIVESHNTAVRQRQSIEDKLARQVPVSDRENQVYRNNLDTVRMAHHMFKDVAKKRGAEITLFFPVNKSRIVKNGHEYQRLVRFADYLATQSRGRKILIISAGSASAFGEESRNKHLAADRAKAPVDILDHYLVNLPHGFYKIYGTGDLYSPKNVSGQIHDRYQHVHLTAVFQGTPHMDETTGTASDHVKPAIPTVSPPHDTGFSVRAGQRFSNSLGMNFVWIPAGTFTMGSPAHEAHRDSNENQHQVTLSRGFFIQQTELTQQQWFALMGKNPSYHQSCGADCPVESINWYDVQNFIDVLNKKENTRRYRLPTEAEWEYAARAGSQDAFHIGGVTFRDYGRNDALDNIAWYYKNSERGTHSVGTKQPNSWGLYDMHGNVWEWCSDWEGRYPSQPITDPMGPEEGQAKVRRGGAWSEYPIFCRSATRSFYNPNDGFPNLGARLIAERELPVPFKPAVPKPVKKAVPKTAFRKVGRKPIIVENKYPLIPLEEECIVIGDMIFNFNSATIRPDMKMVLQRALELVKNKKGNIIVRGHTCAIGSDAYNQQLSEHRVNAVKTFLIKNGIPASRITTQGYGETRPKYDNRTGAGRRLNRRIEIRIQ